MAGIAPDPAVAAQHFRAAAAQGSAIAHSTLGLLHSHGIGVEQDTNAALRHLNEAADLGDTVPLILPFPCLLHVVIGWLGGCSQNANNGLGVMYMNGEGVDVNASLAEHHFRVAIEDGNAQAHNNLGILFLQVILVLLLLLLLCVCATRCALSNRPHVWCAYRGSCVVTVLVLVVVVLQGSGMDVNTSAARFHFKQAADAGFMAAMLNMGRLELYGWDGPRNCSAALPYLRVRNGPRIAFSPTWSCWRASGALRVSSESVWFVFIPLGFGECLFSWLPREALLSPTVFCRQTSRSTTSWPVVTSMHCVCTPCWLNLVTARRRTTQRSCSTVASASPTLAASRTGWLLCRTPPLLHPPPQTQVQQLPLLVPPCSRNLPTLLVTPPASQELQCPRM